MAVQPRSINRIAKEVRLGLVLYGGVSLAIYEYGVTKELYKLIRAARAFDAAYERGGDLDVEAAMHCLAIEQPGEGEPDDGGPIDSERAYFEALVALSGTRPLTVVLDVIAGTSAGGINGVCLARGLAGGRSLDGFRSLWIDDGDIDTLLIGHHFELFGHHFTRLAIARAVLEVCWDNRKAPLDGDLMCRLLKDAFADMAPLSQPLVRADESLDLYTTTTSVHGYDTAIATGTGTISHTDRAYRQLMHFHHEAVPAGTDAPVTHLGDEYVPALAFAARATSSFPGAFPPVSLGTFETAIGGGMGGTVDTTRIAERFVYGLEFGATQQTQSYMDGGVLDNGPFDHAIAAIAAKRAESETARELIYVEPDPGRGPSTQAPGAPQQPSIGNTVWAARVTIPQHTSLGDALGRLRTMNDDIASVGAIVTALIEPVMERLDALASGIEDPARGEDPGQTEQTRDEPTRSFVDVGDYAATLEQAARVRATAKTVAGEFGYPTYGRLRAEAVAQSVAVALAEELGFPPESNRTAFIGAVLREWATTRPEWTSADPQTLDAALSPLDVPFRLRRANFVLQGINDRLAARQVADRDELLALKSATWDVLTQVRAAAHAAAAAVHGSADDLFGAGLAATTPVLADASTHIDPATFLQPGAGGKADLLHRLVLDYQHALAAASLQGSSKQLWDTFQHCTAGWDDAQRRPLLARYVGFPIWDAVIFPTVALAELPQLSPIGVERFSPLDARLLAALDEQGKPREDPAAKLDGVTLAHFGGFFARASRQNDYLWGRLDAAELIMRMLTRQATAGDDVPDLSVQVQAALTQILDSEQNLDDIGKIRKALGAQVAGLGTANLLG